MKTPTSRKLLKRLFGVEIHAGTDRQSSRPNWARRIMNSADWHRSTTVPICSITCRRRWRSSAGSPKRSPSVIANGSPNWNPLVRRNRRAFKLFMGLLLLFTVVLCVLLPAGLLYWIVRAGAAHNYPLMAAGVAVLAGVFALFVYLIRKKQIRIVTELEKCWPASGTTFRTPR